MQEHLVTDIVDVGWGSGGGRSEIMSGLVAGGFKDRRSGRLLAVRERRGRLVGLGRVYMFMIGGNITEPKIDSEEGGSGTD